MKKNVLKKARTSKMDEVEPELKPGKYPSLDDILRDDPEPQFLLPCTICNKTFNPESLQRHSKICEKSGTRKRKQFDSFKQRVQGTGMAEFLSLAPVRKEKSPSPRKSINSWKEKHEAFVSAIRAARCSETTNGKPIIGASSEGRTPLRPSDHEKCPYCGRSFGPKSFDRHLEWCREQRQRQPPSAASLQARERLEARIKYRAPPCKSKRSLMREKYSPVAQRKVREPSPNSPSVMSGSMNIPLTGMTKSLSANSLKSQPPEPPVRYNRAFSSTTNRTQVKENTSNQGLNRGGISRTSIRASQRASQRSVSPKKPATTASTKTSKTPPYRPSSRASDRRSNESLNLVLSLTEAPVVNRNPSNSSLTTKRKSQSNENQFLQSPSQIFTKLEADRSRRNRPLPTLTPGTPDPVPTEQALTHHPTEPTSSRNSSAERLSGSEESNTPYLLSDSESDRDAPEVELTLPPACSMDMLARTKENVALSRKRRRINTPRTPHCIEVYQANVDKNEKALAVFGEEEMIDFDDLSQCCDSCDDFDNDQSTDDYFRGKRTSCSASTYTKHRSSFVDGVLRVSSSEREIDLSELSPVERSESPNATSPCSSRTAASVRRSCPVKRSEESLKLVRKNPGKCNFGNVKKSAKKSGSVTGRRTSLGSRASTPDDSPRLQDSFKVTPLKLALVSVPVSEAQARVSSGRKLELVSAVRALTLRRSAPILPPVLRIKKKVPGKLAPLRKIGPDNASASAASEAEKADAYDPYESAERQMFELFNSDSAADLSVAAENRKNDANRAPSSSPSISVSPSISPTPCPPLETSPTSAFTRYSKESDVEGRTPSPAPAPPPRQHRSVSVELPSLTGQSRTVLQTQHSLDAPLESLVSKRSSDERPRTYDIFSKEERQPSPVSSLKDDSPPDILVMDTPSISVETPPISPPPEFVELREKLTPKAKESRESREVREITDKEHSEIESNRDLSPLSQKFMEFSDEISIDNLMEEVARMQQYVSLMTNTSQPRPKNQSAKSRRSRASKLHIEDYLYPADSPMRGATPVIGDVGNPVLDLNANTDNEDNDVVVSPNALAEALKSEIRPRGDSTDGVTSPIRSKHLGSFSPDSSRSARLSVDAVAPADVRRRLPGDSDEDEVRSSRNSPVPRTTSNRQSTGSRLSGDSAYSSLNRKSPIPSSKGTTPVRPSRHARNTSPTPLLSQSLEAQTLSRDLSSSSSESSLHALSASLTSRKSLGFDASKLSKFCHECGTKFPVSTAKFCPECGIRRLGM